MATPLDAEDRIVRQPTIAPAIAVTATAYSNSSNYFQTEPGFPSSLPTVRGDCHNRMEPVAVAPSR